MTRSPVKIKGQAHQIKPLEVPFLPRNRYRVNDFNSFRKIAFSPDSDVGSVLDPSCIPCVGRVAVRWFFVLE